MDMQMQQPAAGMEAPAGEPGQDQGTSVTITKNPDGTFMVDDKPAKDLDEALKMAAQALGAGQDKMSVEQAFSDGFKGAPQPGMGGY
jgi:hypothetical protein